MVNEEQFRRHFEERAAWGTGDAETSAWSRDGLAARLAAFETLLPELASGPRTRVLDLGCGAGTYTGLLVRKGYAVTAVDYAFAMARRASSAHGGARFVVADGYRLPFRAASFDLVVSIGVLQFSGDAAALIREAAHLLPPGGRLLVETLNRAHFAVPAMALIELLRRRPRSQLLRQPERAVAGWLDAAGFDLRSRLPIYVVPGAPSPGSPRSSGAVGYPVSLAVRSLRRVPPLRRFAATAIWWVATRR